MEIIATVVVIGVIAAIAIPMVSKTSRISKESKITNEVASINRAIQIYKNNGGDLNGLTNPQLVIDRLKTSRTEESAKRYVGFSGSMIDSRVRCELGNAVDGQICAVYNPATQEFELSRGATNCVLEFSLNGAETVAPFEDRDSSLVEYGEEGWIWDYANQTVSTGVNPSTSNSFDPQQSISAVVNNIPSNTETYNEPLEPVTETTPPSNEPGVGDDGLTLIQPCEPPHFLIPSGELPKDQFPVSCPIINPNGENAQIYYMIDGKDEGFKPYNSNFFC